MHNATTYLIVDTQSRAKMISKREEKKQRKKKTLITEEVSFTVTTRQFLSVKRVLEKLFGLTWKAQNNGADFPVAGKAWKAIF